MLQWGNCAINKTLKLEGGHYVWKGWGGGDQHKHISVLENDMKT